MGKRNDFDKLLKDVSVKFKGWDFSFIEDRMKEFPLTWNYNNEIKNYLNENLTLLDMGTGGGEFLSNLKPLPKNTHATECFEPNIIVSKKRLEPLGIKVHGIKDDDDLPLMNNYFDLIINRHESFSSKEVNRILKNDGIFITQQVGGLNDYDLITALGEKPTNFVDWSLDRAKTDLENHGFKIIKSKDCITKTRFYDIGAIVYYLKCIPWIIEDFNVDKYYNKLRKIYELIEKVGYIDFICHRFLIIAKKK